MSDPVAAAKVRAPVERHTWCEARVAAHDNSWTGHCLIAAREAADIPEKYGTAAIAGANTKHRLTVANWSDGESIPDGAFLFYTGGSTGDGHVCWKYREKNGEPLVWSNQDVTDPGGPRGGLRWVRLSTMENWYPNLKRLCIATDCDGVDTAVPPAPPHPTPAT